jgi:hypothetical protein
MPGSPQWSFPSGFPTRTLYTPLPFPIRASCPVHLILLDYITRTMVSERCWSWSSLAHPLSAVRDGLFNIFAVTLQIGDRSSIRNLRTRHAVVTGTHLSRGQKYYLPEKLQPIG